MSEMEKLAAQMKQQRDQKVSSDNALNALTLELDKRIEQWTESVGKLFDEIEIWLDPLAQNDLVKFKRDRVKIEEKLPQNLVAEYEAPVLAMSINEKAARIETVGLFLTDCDGALDFMAREKQYRITRHVGNDVQWMIQAKYGSLRKGVILSQDSFAEAIRHYL